MKETDKLELKKSLTQLKEVVIALSAMLNKNQSGTVIFGINDDGRICGITIGKKTKADITHEIQNYLKPLPLNIEIKDFIEEEKKLIKVSVTGDDLPYSAYGRYYIRVNDADIQMDSHQLQSLFETKDESYIKWEKNETNHSIDEIDEELLIDCIRTANEKGRLDYIYRNPREALHKLDLLTDSGTLNNAGWYLFGKGKPITIKEACFPTDSRTDFGEIKEFRGNIIECIREVLAYIQNHITYRSLIIGTQREEIPEIPIRAIREIVINSFAHCSYARNGDFNQYVIYRSSVSIYNSGNIVRGIDPLNFASGKVGSKIRNILIAGTLYKYGFIDAFGTGFDRTFTLCAKAGVEYEYRDNNFGFTFVFKRNPLFLNDQISEQKSKKQSALDQKIKISIKENKYITIPELALLIGRSEATIHRHLDAMSKLGEILRVGSRKSGYWDLKID